MTATLTAPRRTPSRTAARPARPVTHVLLELAYHLHATKKVVSTRLPRPKG